jgi:hypothetical protein
LDVREAALDDCDVESSQFNHITMSHVLEHLHWPLAALRRCFHLLNRGGRIWISLPNLQASGLTRYGENWRGLEAPRHLAFIEPRTKPIDAPVDSLNSARASQSQRDACASGRPETCKRPNADGARPRSWT